MRYRLRTLLILLAVGPPILAPVIKPVTDEYRRYRVRQHLKEIGFKLESPSSSVFDELPYGARVRYTSSP